MSFIAQVRIRTPEMFQKVLRLGRFICPIEDRHVIAYDIWSILTINKEKTEWFILPSFKNKTKPNCGLLRLAKLPKVRHLTQGPGRIQHSNSKTQVSPVKEKLLD